MADTWGGSWATSWAESWSPDQSVRTVIVGSGPLHTWRDELQARHQKRQLEAQLAKYGRQEKKLVKEKAKVERTIQAERRQDHPVEGILVKYLEIETKISETQIKLHSLENEYASVVKFLGQRISEVDDDEDDLEVLLVS